MVTPTLRPLGRPYVSWLPPSPFVLVRGGCPLGPSSPHRLLHQMLGSLVVTRPLKPYVRAITLIQSALLALHNAAWARVRGRALGLLTM